MGLGLAALAAGLSGQGALAATGDWPTYHRSNARDGDDTVAGPITRITQQWISPTLDGDVYGNPLVVGNQIIVATENNSIYSLDGTTGSSTWAAPANFGMPVTVAGNSLFAGCGNISPDGITGTPVVDPVAGVAYAVAFVHGATDQYQLVAVNLSDGSRRFTPIAINPAGFDVYREQQRGALALANGTVYVPFGGYIGDCQVYHGWVVGIKADGSSTALTVFKDQPQSPCAGTTANEAGIWGASGPAVDAGGNVYVATGNGSSGTAYDCGETVFKLNANLGYLDSWAPTYWATLNNRDTDMGSIGPAVVGTGGNLVFQSGKNGWGYLLDTGALSANANHIGGEAFAAPVCSTALAQPTDPTYAFDQVFGGVAYSDPYVYVPCPEGIKALRLGPGPSFSPAWSGPSFQPGAPILSGGVLWTIDVGGGVLYGLNPATGASLFTASVGTQTHFSTPSAGLGRIFVADGAGPDVVRAFGQGGGQYHTMAPARVYDSRSGGTPLAAGEIRDVPVTNHGGVPASGVLAVFVNVSVTNTTAGSYLTAFPAGSALPNTANLNWSAGRTVSNLVEIDVGVGGQVSLYNAQGRADLIIDVTGWVSVSSASAGPDGLYRPVVPARILDTRTGVGAPAAPIGPGMTIDFQAATGPVPTSGAEAVVFNLTATAPTLPGYLTVYPKGQPRPGTANLSFAAGQTVPNRVVVPLGAGGMVTIYNPVGSVEAIADVSGWFTDVTPGGTGSSFTGVAPARILDTRNGTGGFSAPLGPGQRLSLLVAGRSGVPSMSAAVPPTAVVLNVAVTAPTASSSYLTLWPEGATRPGTADLNFVAGQTVSNLVIVRVGANGRVDVYNPAGSVQVIADVMGWYG